MRIGILYGQPMNIMIEKDCSRAFEQRRGTWGMQFLKEHLEANLYPG
jgi:hypothetical protein